MARIEHQWDGGMPDMKRMDQIYAVVAIGPDGSEGICGGQLEPGGPLMSFVTSRKDHLATMLARTKEAIEGHEKGKEMQVRVIKFTTREDVTDEFGLEWKL